MVGHARNDIFESQFSGNIRLVKDLGLGVTKSVSAHGL